VDPSTVSGYVVGKQDLLKIERAKSGEYFIHNVPAGTHDVVVVASTSGASLWDSLLLKSDKSPNVAVRLNKVEVLNGIRTKKEKVTLPSLISVSGIVTLASQTDHAGIDVYIPGTEYVAKTDSKGAFSFAGVPTGTHNFFFERDGYVRGQMEGVDVDKEPAQSLDAMTLLVDTGTEGFMVLNEGAAVSASKEVKVTLGAGSDSVVMKISENPDFAGAPWKALKTTFTYKFQTGGNKILYAKIANANGLESSPVSAQVVIATQEPLPMISLAPLNCADTSFVLNISTVSGAAPSEMQVSTSGELDGVSWEPFATAKNINRNSIRGPILVNLKDPSGRKKEAKISSIQCLNTLSKARVNFTATSASTKALFAGGNAGNSGTNVVNTVDIFDSVSKFWSTATLSQARSDLASANVGGKALFAGGYTAGGECSNVVDIFDSSTGVWSTATLSQRKCFLSAASVGNKALFAGGDTGHGGGSNVVEIFDSSTGVWSTVTLSQGRSLLSASSVGTKAIFAGGSVGDVAKDVIDIYDNTTGIWSIAALSQARYYLSATSVGTKALFAGGYYWVGNGGWSSNVVDIFDSSTGAWTSATLSQERSFLAATSVGTKALFAGGLSYPGGSFKNVVDVFDSSTGNWSTAMLSQARSYLAATSIGNLAIFAGGEAAGSYSNVVDIYDNNTNTWSTMTTIDLTQL